MRYFMIVALSLALVGCGLSQQVETYDPSTFVSVAAVEPTQNLRVSKLLNDAGIPNDVRGSVAFGVTVRPEDRRRAVEIIRADSKRQGYWAVFYDRAGA